MKMKTENKSTKATKSSKKLADFLKSTQLHKKDFSQMVGVTLSYVYNLIDETIPFSTRSTTLERIATVMDIKPEEFQEYHIPQEPIVIDETVEFLKDKLYKKGLSTVQFLKSFPRKKRIEIVDILRGALPIPINWSELKLIADNLDITDEELFPHWENRMKEILKTAGMNIRENQLLVDKMFECAKEVFSQN